MRIDLVWDTGYYPSKKGGNVKVDLSRSLKTLEIEDQQHGTLMYLDVGDINTSTQ